MIKEKKAVFIVGSANVGGTEKQIITLASQLNKNSFKCHIVFLINGGSLEEMCKKLDVPYSISNLSRRNLLKTSKNLYELIENLKKQQFDIYYLFLPHSILYVGPILRWIIKNKKIIYGVRGSIYRKNNIFYKLYRKEIVKADLIVCNSKAIKKELSQLKNANPSKIRLIHNGVNSKITEKVESTVVGMKENNRIVVLANFHSYKGHDLLLDSLELIKEPSLDLTFIGDGETYSEIKSRVLKISNHKFNFVGKVENVSEILATQKFAIHPSRTEGLSNAILEELSAGLPVIAFDVGGNCELISNSINGFLVELGDINELADKIKTLCSDESLFLQMSAKARESVKEFTWQKNIQNHIESFR